MAIVKQRGLQLTVETINDRNDIEKKPEHLVVHVRDAIADIDAGAGPAVYRWAINADDVGIWILVSAGAERTMTFVTEELTVSDDQVIASNIPTNDHIWGIQILDDNEAIGYPRVEDLDISAGTIDGLGDWNGYKLRFTYAYGTLTSQMQAAIDIKSTLYESETDPLTVDNNTVKPGDMWHDLGDEGRVAICLTISDDLTWTEV